MSTTSQKIQTIKEHIKGYPDFPTKNVLFRYIPIYINYKNHVLLSEMERILITDMLLISYIGS